MRSCESLLCCTGFCSVLATILLHFKGAGLSIWAHRRISGFEHDQQPPSIIPARWIWTSRVTGVSYIQHLHNCMLDYLPPTAFTIFTPCTGDLTLKTVILFEPSRQHQACSAQLHTTLNLVQLVVTLPIYISFRSHSKLPQNTNATASKISAPEDRSTGWSLGCH